MKNINSFPIIVFILSVISGCTILSGCSVKLPFINKSDKENVLGKSVEESSLPSSQAPSLLPDSKSYLKSDECTVIFEGKDPGTGELKKELAFEHLFSFTPPNIKPYFPGRGLLTADARVIKFSGGYTYLSIRFLWNAKDPQTAYGRLKSQGAIRCALTRDKTVTLYNSRESSWEKGEDMTNFTMESLFLIHPKQIKLLRNYPLMKMTVYWERGYEAYPIYPITFFIDQLGCLE